MPIISMPMVLFCAMLLWVSGLISSTLGSSIQFCQADPQFFCFAVSRKHNETSNGEDLYLTLSATPSEYGGWVSVGFGSKMKGSPMFIVYADQAKESLITSVRTAGGHTMPEVLPEDVLLNQIRVLNATASEDNYFAQFVCYGCWSTHSDVDGVSPFIYAGNQEQAFTSANIYTDLMIHNYSGVVWGDIDIAALVVGEEDPAPSIQGNQIIGFTKSTPKSARKAKGFMSAVQLHGVIMTLSFMVLFVGGSIAIRLPLLRAFKYHWLIQASASVLALGSGLYMFLRASHFGLHKTLGLVVICSLILQAAAGYKHHIDFVKIRRQTIFTLVHRWLGRGILVLGTFNVGLGMYYRHWSFLGMLVWFVIWVVEIVGYGYVLLQHDRRKREVARYTIPKNNLEEIADAEIFDIGDDFDEYENDVEGVPLVEHSGRHGAK